MKILVIDVGGNNIKLLATGQEDRTKIPSGSSLTAQGMVDKVREATADWDYEAISIGCPGPVKDNRLVLEPVNLGSGWMDMDFDSAFEKPVRVINDAAMQALGSYEGGTMLFMGLGTGLGTAMVHDGTVCSLELAHLPYRKGETFEHYVGVAGLKRMGKKEWRIHVTEVVAHLKAAMCADYVVLGGGNSKKLDELPEGARLGHNNNAFVGGFRLWKN